ncbi:50S ribosomal protein L3 [Pumilibacter muris]|uniref:50S ribosomal protein L3 n=1 Tax=Pumilibacter muris TaxID=2941510 RepID=UPI00203E3969|nr:50S ribosomal protein L3 [Pumilibacter muris]
MDKAILGRKVGMTSIFDETGLSIAVTVVEAGPMTVVRKKTPERDGYSAVLVSFEDAPKHQNKAEAGVYKKANVASGKILREFKFSQPDKFEVGSKINCDIFAGGDMVDVSAVSKGHGFSGVIKRWNQRRLKMTHGTGPVHRSVGSTGANSTPSKVIKGLHMPGHYGHDNVTIQNLKIVKVDAARNVLLIRGAIPGPKGALVTVKQSVKSK